MLEAGNYQTMTICEVGKEGVGGLGVGARLRSGRLSSSPARHTTPRGPDYLQHPCHHHPARGHLACGHLARGHLAYGHLAHGAHPPGDHQPCYCHPAQIESVSGTECEYIYNSGSDIGPNKNTNII